eukprot:CAMPEP_0205859006 /NCGR_PEP_ID=MMETSP1083-20121108/4500_1 /ASSEMBLY_ACC=CAM_ASM_000430 /TAXON_ID=97485 /ORGANISM="Prymnesium parvum, Strain Texoma1" /LENGTH=56 /DNA_ID=CAMNT_0053220603 /DNA_START=255 /DNA_END=425 /DNA_ORIENTATION=-
MALQLFCRSGDVECGFVVVLPTPSPHGASLSAGRARLEGARTTGPRVTAGSRGASE